MSRNITNIEYSVSRSILRFICHNYAYGAILKIKDWFLFKASLVE